MEVLEEDLKTTTSRQLSNHLSTFTPELENMFWAKNVPQQGHLDEPPPISTSCYAATKKSSMPSVGIYSSAYNQAANFLTDTKIKTSSSESDYYIHQRHHEMTCSLTDNKVHVPSTQEIYFSTKTDWWGSPHKIGSPLYSYSEQEQWNSMTYFWTQTEREAHLLNNISNQELLTQDEKGKT